MSYIGQPPSGGDRPHRIMIAEDNLDMLPLYEIIGNIPDTIITIQTGGLSALRMLDRLNYAVDAAVIDLAMADRDGLSVTKDIRSQEDLRQKAHPIMLFWLTVPDMANMPTILEAKTRLRVTEIFLKPHNPQDIVFKVRDYLKG